MAVTVLLMVTGDIMHPPAIATSLSFAFRSGRTSHVLQFALAVGLIVVLVGLQWAAQWLGDRLTS